MENSVWRVIATGLFSLFIGAMGTWFTLGDKPTRVEVKEMILAQTPSPLEWRALREEMIGMRIDVARMNEQLQSLRTKVGAK